MVIAIDGPAGSGKSTVSKGVAKRLGFVYIDTGAMYRTLTLKALENKLNLLSSKDLVAMAQKTEIMIKNIEGSIHIFMDGQDVSEKIRTPEVTRNIFHIADDPAVRKIMVKLQRHMASKSDSVLEGRDITSVVFPDADYKFFVDASFDERAKRRYEEFKSKNIDISLDMVRKDLSERDYKDKNRPVGALKIVPDANYLDTTNLSVDQVIDKIISSINKV